MESFPAGVGAMETALPPQPERPRPSRQRTASSKKREPRKSLRRRRLKPNRSARPGIAARLNGSVPEPAIPARRRDVVSELAACCVLNVMAIRLGVLEPLEIICAGAKMQLTDAGALQEGKAGRMQGASVTPRGGSGFLVNNAGPHTLLRQEQGGQHANRAGSHHQDFGSSVVRHKLL